MVSVTTEQFVYAPRISHHFSGPHRGNLAACEDRPGCCKGHGRCNEGLRRGGGKKERESLRQRARQAPSICSCSDSQRARQVREEVRGHANRVRAGTESHRLGCTSTCVEKRGISTPRSSA